jgi:hypothetical protein
MARKTKKTKHPASDPMLAPLATFRDPMRSDWQNAWFGMEPTFQSKKSVRKWVELAEQGEKGEAAYFKDDYMLGTLRRVAKAIEKRYRARRKEGADCCMFDRVERREELDQWGVVRQNLTFRWPDDGAEAFEVRLTIDPETFEYSIKPVPLAWCYDARFVGLLQEMIWKPPHKAGLAPSIVHGGAQFSLSAKTWMTGCLLADDIADKLNHPELATWVMDWPNPDDRAFRATTPRFAAFRSILERYREGAFHPRAIGTLTPLLVFLDRGFGPAPSPPAGLMNASGSPKGSGREIFLTNFAFGRAVRQQAQNVEPGYWQSAHPTEEGYRPDQIMRYGESNLNRLQIAGELHVKSGEVLDEDRVPPAGAHLDQSMLYGEASWENRAQMGRTSARDFVEALLLDVHNARWLQANPRVQVVGSLLQDQLLGDAEETVRRHGSPKTLAKLHRAAAASNLEASRGRLRSDWIEPEPLMWVAWKVLPAGERGALAREVVHAFVERVTRAASFDPRPEARTADPMEWHRHRIHPVLWKSLEKQSGLRASDPAARELSAWKARRQEYLARRPSFSPVDRAPSL